MKRISIVLGAALCAATIIIPASAQSVAPRIVKEITVRYDDLDLESDTGARAMLARLDDAATEACGGNPSAAMSRDHVGIARHLEYRRCKVTAIELSTRRLDSPLVRAAWLDKRSPGRVRSGQPSVVGAR